MNSTNKMQVLTPGMNVDKRVNMQYFISAVLLQLKGLKNEKVQI